MSSQIPLQLETEPSLTRADFIVANGNRDALAFVESWPAWTVAAAALYGPQASGKSHLCEIWTHASGGTRDGGGFERQRLRAFGSLPSDCG